MRYRVRPGLDVRRRTTLAKGHRRRQGKRGPQSRLAPPAALPLGPTPQMGKPPRSGPTPVAHCVAGRRLGPIGHTGDQRHLSERAPPPRSTRPEVRWPSPDANRRPRSQHTARPTAPSRRRPLPPAHGHRRRVPPHQPALDHDGAAATWHRRYRDRRQRHPPGVSVELRAGNGEEPAWPGH